MKLAKLVMVLALALGSLGACSSKFDADETLHGTWLSEDGLQRVEITPNTISRNGVTRTARFSRLTAGGEFLANYNDNEKEKETFSFTDNRKLNITGVLYVRGH